MSVPCVSDRPVVTSPMMSSLLRTQRLDHVVVGPHDARHLIHCRRLQGNRLKEVPHKEHIAKGRAPLRAMQQRQAPGQAKKSQRRTKRLTNLERINRQRHSWNG